MLPLSVSDKGVHVSRKRRTYLEGQDVSSLTISEGRDVIAAIWQLCKIYQTAANSPGSKLWQNQRVNSFLDDKNSNKIAKNSRTVLNDTLNGSLNISAIQPAAPCQRIQELQEQLLQIQIQEAQEKLLTLQEQRAERSIMNQSSLSLKSTRQALLQTSMEAQKNRTAASSQKKEEKQKKAEAKQAFKLSIAPIQALVRETRKIPVTYDPRGPTKKPTFTIPSGGEMAQWLREYERQATTMQVGICGPVLSERYSPIFKPSHDLLTALDACLKQAPSFVPISTGFIRYIQKSAEEITRQERAAIASSATLSNASVISRSIDDATTLKLMLDLITKQHESASASYEQRLKRLQDELSATKVAKPQATPVVEPKKKGWF